MSDYNINNDSLTANYVQLINNSYNYLLGDYHMHTNAIKIITNSISHNNITSHLWMLDSGTSHTITWMCDHFVTFTPSYYPVCTITHKEF